MQFSVPGDNTWHEGKLILEGEHLYFSSRDESTRFFSRVLPLRRGEKIHNIVPVGSIRDVIREKRDRLSIKYLGTVPPQAPVQGRGQQLLTSLVAAEHVLNDVERELVLRLDATRFTVYRMVTGDELHEKAVELEKVLLKINAEALWIVGRAALVRIAGDDLVQVKQTRRGVYQGTEYAALSLEYLSEQSARTNLLSTRIITKGRDIEAVSRALLELRNAYTPDEKLTELENRIITMIYTGELNIAPSARLSAALALGVSGEEFVKHVNHLNELGLLDLANERLKKKGLKYAILLSGQGTPRG